MVGMVLVLVLVLGLGIGCGVGSIELEESLTSTETSESTTNTTIDTTGTTNTTTATTTTGTTTQTTTTTTTGKTPVIDCAAIEQTPTLVQLDAPRAYHDIVFDDEGNLIGNHNNMLYKAPSSTKADVWIPSVGYYEGMAVLPDGDIVAIQSSQGKLERISPDGTRTTIVNGLYAYGLTVGPNGMVYLADYYKVQRVDPETGDMVAFVAGFPNNVSPKVVEFNRDDTRLYIGSISNDGSVYYVDLDEDMLPTTEPQLFATNAGTWHDGMGVDACGNIYVNDYDRSRLYRITEEGAVDTYYDFSWTSYGHGIEWGSNIGEWDDHTIYVPQPYNNNKVAYLDIGVPSKNYNGGNYQTINE